MKRLLAAIIVALLALLAVLTAHADDSTQPGAESPLPATRASLDVISHIQQQLHGINSVESDFVETKNLAMLNHTLNITGHIGLAKPDRMIWIVRTPVKYAVRIEGDEVKQWDEDTNKVDTVHLGGDPTFKAVSEQIQAWFLGDYKVLGDSYTVYQLQQQPVSLAFVPNPQSVISKLIKRIDLTFNPEETYIDTLVIRETGGDVTSIHFINSRINQPVPPSAWEMPPNEP